MTWTFKEGVPIYMQIVQKVKNDIASGHYEPGERIPSVREMAVGAGVNPNTMQRAFTELEREGYLYSVRTSGRFVTDKEEVMKELRKSLSREFVKALFDNLKELGMSDEEIVRAVREWAEGERI